MLGKSSTFVNMYSTKRRHIASWLLLAVFVPILFFSSLHVHEGSVLQAETECTGCMHNSCHGHLTQTALWTHDCVLCQFLTLIMLTATATAVTVYIHVCKTNLAQPLYGYHAGNCGIIVTRGPPTVWPPQVFTHIFIYILIHNTEWKPDISFCHYCVSAQRWQPKKV